MKQKLKEIWGKADDIVLRYPMVLTMALIAAVSSVVAIDMDNYENQFSVVTLIFTACLGISLMFALKMLSQRIGKELPLQIAGVLFLLGFYYILPKNEKNFTEVYGYLLACTFILSHLLVSFIAFYGEKRELNFWQYNKNLFINIFLTAVFTGVLVGGVMLAILAVDKLFDFNFKDNLYPKTFFFLAILGSCFIFLLFIEKGLKQLEQDGNYPQILKFFTQFVLIPLLLIYAVILYFYSAKILVNWELPRGWVSYLVLAYSVVGILALLLVHPLKEDSTKSWVKVFSKIFYYTLLPLIVLLFVAIFTRILEYGYTEPRYFVLMLALWLSSVVLYFIFYKKATIKFVPVSLFVFGLFALIMPYLNTFSVAKRSQKTELKNVLIKNNLLENGKIDFGKKITDTVADEVANKFDFLARRKQNDFLLNYLPEANHKKFNESFAKMDTWKIRGDIRNAFTNISRTQKKNTYNGLVLVSAMRVIPISEYDYAVTFNPMDNPEIQLENQNLNIKYRNLKDEKYLKISLESQSKIIYTYDLMPFIQETVNQNINKTNQVELPEISKEFTLHSYDMKAYFKRINYFPVDKAGNFTISEPYEITLLIRKK